MAEAERLFDIFSRHGTDKVYYASAYQFFLEERRHGIRKLLEIGIGSMTEGAAYGMVGYAASHYRPGGSLGGYGIMKHRDRFIPVIGHSLILGASLFNNRFFPTKYDHNPIFIVKEGKSAENRPHLP